MWLYFAEFTVIVNVNSSTEVLGFSKNKCFDQNINVHGDKNLLL